jgi:valyl-tRNA synthetase
MQAHQATSRMFWSIYCDRYLEMIKDRLGGDPDRDSDRDSTDRNSTDHDSTDLEYPGRADADRDRSDSARADRARADRDSARWTLLESFRVLLGLFAPFAPFLTEHMYQRFYRAREDVVSLHLTGWPVADERWRGDRSAVDQLAVILDATRVLRSGQRLGNSARLRQLILQAHDAQAAALLDQIAEPLRIAARADAVILASAEHPSGVAGITVAIEA